MKRIFWCVALAFSQIYCPVCRSQSDGSPVGEWDAKTPARGQLVFVFSTNQTFTTYGVSLNNNGLFMIAGTWSAVGKELSGLFEQIHPPVVGLFNFTGKFSATRLKFVVSGNSGIRIKCRPLSPPLVVTGDWNVQTTAGTNLTSSISITESNGFPRVFAISDTNVTGVMMVDSKGKALAFVESGDLDIHFRGKFNATTGAARLKGRDQSGHTIKWKLEPAP